MINVPEKICSYLEDILHLRSIPITAGVRRGMTLEDVSLERSGLRRGGFANNLMLFTLMILYSGSEL